MSEICSKTSVFGENYSSFESSTSGLSNHVNDLYSNDSEAKSAKILVFPTFLLVGLYYTVNVLSAESTDECLRTKSKDN